MTKLLDNTSFGVLRTNPKLTTNVKLTVTSDDQLYLNSIESTPKLANSNYKNFKVTPNTSYEFDVFNFWKKGKTPKEIAYALKVDKESSIIKSKYRKQLFNLYSYGAQAEISPYYDEQFSLFAPIWLDNILPGYFVIFKLDGPLSVSQFDVDMENSTMSNIATFNENFVKNAKIIKTFDLSQNSNIGLYLRNFIGNSDNNKNCVNFSFEKKKLTQWNGISYQNGGFTNKYEDLYDQYVLIDKTITEQDHYATLGFQRNGIIDSRLLNLEFLFDDPNASPFEINRYYGLYVNKEIEFSFKPEKVKNEIIYSKESKPELLDYPKPNEASYYFGIDANNNFYTIDSNYEDDLSIKTKESLNESDIITFGDPDYLIPSFDLNQKGRAYTSFTLNDNPVNGDWYILGEVQEINLDTSDTYTNNETYTQKLWVTDENYKISSIQFDYNLNTYNESTLINLKPGESISALSSLTLVIYDCLIISSSFIGDAGFAKRGVFSNKGTVNQSANAMAKAINNVSGDNYYAVVVNDTVYVVAASLGSRFNESLRVFRNPYIGNNPIIIDSDDSFFKGGNDNAGERLAIDASWLTILEDPSYYIKCTDNTYKQLSNITQYLDEPEFNEFGRISNFNNLETYINIEVEDCEIFRDNQGNISVHTQKDFNAGRFSIFPIRDFDFSFDKTDYGSDLDEIYKDYILKAPDWGGSIPEISEFTGFNSLWDLQDFDGNISKLNNEYDRLKERYITTISTVSRYIPYIVKWVRDGDNIREIPYRITTSEAFGLNNFAPSFKVSEPNPQYFTHEWYYLGKYPDPIISGDDGTLIRSYEELEKINLFFRDSLNIDSLKDINTDYFTQYFTVEEKPINTNSGSWEYVSVPTETRYSTFLGGNDIQFPSAFFRGVNVVIKQRSETFEDINFNLETIPVLRNTFFNDYKFTAVLVPINSEGSNLPTTELEFIENRKFKNITLLVKVDLTQNDNILGTEQIHDHVSLYTLRHKYDYNNPSNYSNITISGSIDLSSSSKSYYDGEKWFIEGIPDVFGILPRFIEEINVKRDGSFFSSSTTTLKSTSSTFDIEIDVLDVVSNNGLFAKEIRLNGTPITSSLLSRSIWENITYEYLEGGFNYFTNIINRISFGSIAEDINQGNPNIKYTTITSDGSVLKNRFVIELEEPQVLPKASFLNVNKDRNKPSPQILNEFVGYDIVIADKIKASPIYRYGGASRPKFIDIIKFKDSETIKEKNKNKNLVFDTDNSNFGIINLYGSKINKIKPEKILSITPESEYKPLYPLIDEVPIYNKNINVFKSNWETGYYDKFVSKSKKESIAGTREYFNTKSYFGSHVMNLPEQFRIETFDINNVSLVETNNVFNISVDVKTEFINKILLLDFETQFINNINPNWTVNGDINDYILGYLNENIIPRYRVSKIEFYNKSFIDQGNTPRAETGLLDFEKIQNRYIKSSSFRFNSNSQLETNISHRISNIKVPGYSITFTIILSLR